MELFLAKVTEGLLSALGRLQKPAPSLFNCMVVCAYLCETAKLV